MLRLSIRCLVNFLSMVLMAGIAAVAAFAIRLAIGPISLDAAAPRLAEQVNAELTGWNVSLDGAALMWDREEREVGVQLRALRLFDGDGAETAAAPDATVRFALGAAIRGQIEPTEATLRGVELVVVRTEEGLFRVALGHGDAQRPGKGRQGDGRPGEARQVETGDAAPAHRSIIGPGPEAVIDPDQREPAPSFAERMATREDAESDFSAMRAIVEGMSGDRDAAPFLNRFQRIRVRDADVAFIDEMTGASWRSEDAALTIERTEDGLSASFDAAVDTGQGGPPLKLALSGARARDAETVTVRAAFQRASGAALAALLPHFEPLKAITGEIEGGGSATLALASGDLVGAQAALSVHDALIALGDETAPIHLHSASAAFDYDPRTDLLALSRLSLREAGVALEATGEAALRRGAPSVESPAGSIVGLDGAINILSAEVGARFGFEPALQVVGGGMTVSFRADPLRVTLDDLRIETPDATFDGVAEVVETLEVGPLLTVEGDVAPFAADRLIALWPRDAAPGARAWVDRNIKSGRLDAVALSLRAPLDPDSRRAELSGWRGQVATSDAGATSALSGDLGADDRRGRGGGGQDARSQDARSDDGRSRDGRRDEARDGAPRGGGLAAGVAAVETVDLAADPLLAPAFEVAFAFSDLKSSYFAEMPLIQDAVGWGRVTLNAFELEVEEGWVDLDAAGALRVDGSRFEIPDFSASPTRGEVDLKTSGPIAAALRLIDYPPLGFTQRLGVSPDAVAGDAETETRLELPLRADVQLTEIDVVSASTLRDLSLRTPDSGLSVVAERAALVVDTKAAVVDGAMTVSGEPFDVVWRYVFSPEDDAPRSVATLRTPLNAERLIGWGVPSEMIGPGAAAFQARIERRDGVDPTARVTIDAEDLALALPQIGWDKLRGGAARASADVVFGDDRIAVRSLIASSAEAELAGWATLKADGAPRRIVFDRLRVGEDTDLGVDAALAPDGLWRIALRGDRLDLGRLAAASWRGADARDGGAGIAAPSGAEASTPVEITASIARARLSSGRVVHDLTAFASRSDDGLDVDAAGRVAGEAAMEASYREMDDGPARFTLDAPDAGAFLKAMEILPSGAGGRLSVNGQATDGRLKGVAVIDGLVVKDAPAAAQALSIGSLIGAFDALGSGGITFNRIEAPFRYANGVLRVDGATAVGPSLGATLSGDYKLESKRLDFKGSVSPAYLVQGVVSNIPIVGDLLTGGRGEGLVGVAYSISGTSDAPNVSANPLSAFLPGILRRPLSRHRSDDFSDDPDDAAAPERSTPRMGGDR